MQVRPTGKVLWKLEFAYISYLRGSHDVPVYLERAHHALLSRVVVCFRC